MAKTTEQARKYFEDSGLTYNDIEEVDFAVLLILLKKHMHRANKYNITSVDMRVSRIVNGRFKTNGQLIECYLFVNSHYFKKREAISFNKNGFIGFCGWAGGRNHEPFINAFIEWVDTIKLGGAQNEIK